MSRKGQNLRVFVGGKCVAVSTSCTFHVAVQTESSSTKDSTGGYEDYEAVGKSWDVSCDTLYDPEAPTETNAITPAELMAKIITEPDPTVELKWEATTVGSEKNRTATGKGFEGTAIMNDANVTSPNRQNSTSTFQFQGKGELKAITA